MPHSSPLSEQTAASYQALRDDVRRKLEGLTPDLHPVATSTVSYFRLENLLDEGDELQREVSRRLPPEDVAEGFADLRFHLQRGTLTDDVLTTIAKRYGLTL